MNEMTHRVNGVSGSTHSYSKYGCGPHLKKTKIGPNSEFVPAVLLAGFLFLLKCRGLLDGAVMHVLDMRWHMNCNEDIQCSHFGTGLTFKPHTQ